LPIPVREYVFAAPRRFRFDWAFVPLCLAVEVEGIVYPKRGQGGHLTGRHVSVQGFQRDIFKYALAFTLGWTVLRVLPDQLRSGQAADWVHARLEAYRLTDHEIDREGSRG
jgi:hypothetical protein